MDIKIIASSSKGNAYVISDDSKHVLIDPGVNIKTIRKAVDFNLSDLDFCLLSHEHKDHSRSIRDISRYGINCFMSKGTQDNIDKKYSAYDYIIGNGSFIDIDGWTILAFDVKHDAAAPLGFLLMSPTNKIVLYATDTYYLEYKFTGVTHYLVECNYSENLLQKNAGIHEDVKSRIRTSHFELENVKEFFKAQDLSKTEKIYLLHLSDENSDEKLFVNEIEKVTGKPVYTS